MFHTIAYKGHYIHLSYVNNVEYVQTHIVTAESGFDFKPRRTLVLLCQKFSFTSQQHGHRRSLRIMARAMSSRSVEIESGTWRCTRPAAARDVTFG
jgi:hypothetical protein